MTAEKIKIRPQIITIARAAAAGPALFYALRLYLIVKYFANSRGEFDLTALLTALQILGQKSLSDRRNYSRSRRDILRCLRQFPALFNIEGEVITAKSHYRMTGKAVFKHAAPSLEVPAIYLQLKNKKALYAVFSGLLCDGHSITNNKLAQATGYSTRSIQRMTAANHAAGIVYKIPQYAILSSHGTKRAALRAKRQHSASGLILKPLYYKKQYHLVTPMLNTYSSRACYNSQRPQGLEFRRQWFKVIAASSRGFNICQVPEGYFAEFLAC